MKKDYQNKMVTEGETENKALGERVEPTEAKAVKPVVEGAHIPFEGQHKTRLFYFPQYGRSVEAETQEEAEQKLKDELK